MMERIKISIVKINFCSSYSEPKKKSIKGIQIYAKFGLIFVSLDILSEFSSGEKEKNLEKKIQKYQA